MKSALTLAAIALTLSTGNALAHDEDVLQMSPPGAPYIQVSDAGIHPGSRHAVR